MFLSVSSYESQKGGAHRGVETVVPTSESDGEKSGEKNGFVCIVMDQNQPLQIFMPLLKSECSSTIVVCLTMATRARQ